MSICDTQVIVPVKRFDRALGRLSRVLSRSERAVLQLAMLEDLLTACTTTPEVAEILLVSSDSQARDAAATVGARCVADHDPPRGMNAAVALGQADAARHNRRALILTADLPLVTPEDLTVLTSIGTESPAVVLVPSHTGDGTNALLLDHAQVIETRLGPNSRARHQAAATAAACSYRELTLERIGLDIDNPEDLARLIARGPSERTGIVCDAYDLVERLKVAA